MAQWRKWHSDASTSKAIWLNTSNPLSPMLFPYIIAHMDDDGRMEYHPASTMAVVCPLGGKSGITPETFDAAVNDLCAAGLLIRYSVGNQEFLSAIPAKWQERQPVRADRKKDSTLPQPPSGCQPATNWQPSGNRDNDTDHDHEKIRPEKKKKKQAAPSLSLEDKSQESREVTWCRANLTGLADLPAHHIAGLYAAWQSVAQTSHIDLEDALTRASAFAVSKTASGHPYRDLPRFYTNWVNREKPESKPDPGPHARQQTPEELREIQEWNALWQKKKADGTLEAPTRQSKADGHSMKSTPPTPPSKPTTEAATLTIDKT